MDFNSMSDHELLLVINLKSETKYSYEQLQEARKVYIERISGSSARSAVSSPASENCDTPVSSSAEPKRAEPITAFDIITDDTEPVEDKTTSTLSGDTILIPPLPKEETDVPVFSDEAAMEGQTTLFRPITDEMLAAAEVDTTDESDTEAEVETAPAETEQEAPVSYTYMPIDDTPVSYKPHKVKRESGLSRFFHGLLAYVIMPLIMLHELYVFASSIVLLVSNFRSIFYHVCTLTDFVYMIFILFAWYFILNRRNASICRVFIYTEIIRTLFNLSLQNTYFEIISIVYIILLVLTSFTLKDQD